MANTEPEIDIAALREKYAKNFFFDDGTPAAKALVEKGILLPSGSGAAIAPPPDDQK